MTRYALLLSVFIALMFTACNPAPDVPLSPQLDRYAQIQENCEGLQTTPGILVPDALDKACRSFLLRLEKANDYDYKVAHYNDGKKNYATKDKPELIMLKTEANRQHRKTEVDYLKLSKLLNTLSLEAIDKDELSDVELTLTFPETKFTKKHYDYYKNQAPEYQKGAQYLAFEKHYARELVIQGLYALSQGHKKQALKHFKMAAELKSAEGMFLVGVVYEAKYVDKAIVWHTKALDHGVESARIHLARLYLRKHQPKEAQHFYLEAAEAGDAYAQYLLYTQYKKTDNTKAKAKAVLWLEKSAENGFPPAEYAYGLQLLKEKKRTEAKEWLHKAVSHGINAANATLGAMYYKEKDYEKALLHLKAAKSSYAKYRLARMYELGLGVKVNYYRAAMLFKEAEKLGRKNIKKELLRLAKLATPKERAHYEAEQRKLRQQKKHFDAANGTEPTLRNLRDSGRLIQLKGLVSLPLPSAQGFLLSSEDGKQFFVLDLKSEAKPKQYEYVDITAKTSGHAVTISSADGLTTEIYQLYFQKYCH